MRTCTRLMSCLLLVLCLVSCAAPSSLIAQELGVYRSRNYFDTVPSFYRFEDNPLEIFHNTDARKREDVPLAVTVSVGERETEYFYQATIRYALWSYEVDIYESEENAVWYKSGTDTVVHASFASKDAPRFEGGAEEQALFNSAASFLKKYVDVRGWDARCETDKRGRYNLIFIKKHAGFLTHEEVTVTVGADLSVCDFTLKNLGLSARLAGVNVSFEKLENLTERTVRDAAKFDVSVISSVSLSNLRIGVDLDGYVFYSAEALVDFREESSAERSPSLEIIPGVLPVVICKKSVS